VSSHLACNDGAQIFDRKRNKKPPSGSLPSDTFV
jgi:hypothetical protein